MNFHFGKKSREYLDTVDPQLRLVALKALELTPIDFGITEGIRSNQRQRELVEQGKSKTLKSKHIEGKAIDIVCYVSGRVTWELQYYQIVANAFGIASHQLGINIRWGGSWIVNDFSLNPHNKFIDAVHYELAE